MEILFGKGNVKTPVEKEILKFEKKKGGLRTVRTEHIQTSLKCTSMVEG